MHQKIAAVAGTDNVLCRAGVTGDHDAAVGSVKAVSIRKIPGAVRDGKGTHSYVCVFVDDAGMNLMRVDVICLRVSVFQAVDPNVEVFR